MELIEQINKCIRERSAEIESWFERKGKNLIIPLYTSVDLRVSRNKLVPVDTNVFPAGFNNLSQEFREAAAKLFQGYFDRNYPSINDILIIPELLTRNSFYWENIYVLKSILKSVGYRVDVGVVSKELEADKIAFETSEGNNVVAHKVLRDGYKVHTSEFTPDLILINNDFSEKCPEVLHDITQPVEPPFEIGWHTRKKDIHFEFYNALAKEIANIINLDSWRITIETESISGVDFDDPRDREKVAELSDSMLVRLKTIYSECGVEDEPYLFVKSNSGTYGMAVHSISHGDEIRNLNSEGRKRMRVTKSGNPVRDVVVQEGVPTYLYDDTGVAAEPVLYLVDAKVAGGFLRLNKGKNQFENLNTRGMEFAHIPGGNGTDKEKSIFLSPLHRLVARTASLAAGYEIEKILKEGGGCKEQAS